MKEKLFRIIKNFENKKILVIGDIMLDKYIWGDVSRISPEAPVQIVNVKNETYSAGGAGNTANNISSLGGKAFIVGLVGMDSTKKIIISKLKEKNIVTDGIIVDKDRPTILKVRVMAQSQQLLRVDYENKDYLDGAYENLILEYIKKNIGAFNAVVISDYSKGIITEGIMAAIKEIMKDKKIPLIVDPKPKHKEFYKNSSLITPNAKEACSMADCEEDEAKINEVGKKLINELNSTILITRGEKGMTLFEKNGLITNIPTKAKEVYDVSGAGDTVVAALSLALASGATMKEAAIIANYAAGIVVGKIGTSSVSIEELKGSIENE